MAKPAEVVENQNVNSLSLIESVDIQAVYQTMQKIANFQAIVKKTLRKGHDYGTVPGTDKDTLFKPGAEKILMLLGLSSEYELIEKIEDYEDGFFAYTIKCILTKNGYKITEGVGSCNTKESKYLYRWVPENKLPNHVDKKDLEKREVEGKYGKYFLYRLKNDDPYSIANTVLKMAKKRAQVDAALTVAALSDIFTQDLEDLYEVDIPETSAQQEQQQSKKKGRKDTISEAQARRMFSIAKGNADIVRQALNELGYKDKGSTDVLRADYDTICARIEALLKEQKEQEEQAEEAGDEELAEVEQYLNEQYEQGQLL